jgi:hypothetical protein
MVERSTFETADNEIKPVSSLFPLQHQNATPAALPTETCKVVAARMASLHLQRLPVIDSLQHRRVIGIISRSDLVKPSQHYFDEEQKRERLISS